VRDEPLRQFRAVHLTDDRAGLPIVDLEAAAERTGTHERRNDRAHVQPLVTSEPCRNRTTESPRARTANRRGNASLDCQWSRQMRTASSASATLAKPA